MSELLLGGTGSAPNAKTLELPDVGRLTFSVLLVSAGYYAGGIVGILLGFPPSGIAAIWPPTAILLAALLLTPPRHWWLYLLAAVPTHLHLVATFQRPEVPFLVMLGQLASNAIHAFLAALAVRFVIGAPPRFDSLRNMTAFILVAGIAVTAVACALAVAFFMMTGWAPEFWLAWRQRFLGNLFPFITIVPLIVLTFAGRIVSARPARPRDYVELAVLTGGLLAVCIPVFGWEPPGTGIVPALLLAPLPLLLWAAVRLGPGGLSIALLIVAAASLSNASVGHGPFVSQSPADNVLALQIFLSAISIPLMLLAALVEERRRTEERLKQSEERMAFAATSANIGLWQFDNETGRFWATEHCRSMFALPSDTPLTPDALLDAVHPEDRRAATEGMRQAIDAGVAAAGEFRVLLPDGQTRWILAQGHARDDEQGRRIQASGLFADITARKKAEQEAHQRISELAHMNRHVTVGELSSALAHELNQPLGAVLANAETAEMIVNSPSPDMDAVREILSDIRRDNHRAGEIIQRLRTMLKKAPSEIKNLDLNDVVREVFDFLSIQARARHVTLSNVPAAQMLQVSGDRIQIQQVILNLIVNGMDAMAGAPDGQRKIIGRTSRLDDSFAEISIADFGPGISADDLEKVFDPFFTTKTEGMGMGLSIARTIVEAHGGRIWAENQAAGGAVFRLALPLTKSVQGSA